jgi:hypothetical protein
LKHFAAIATSRSKRDPALHLEFRGRFAPHMEAAVIHVS